MHQSVMIPANPGNVDVVLMIILMKLLVMIFWNQVVQLGTL